MLAGKTLPSWLREIDDEIERSKLIEGLTANDVFPNQFRTTENAPKCSIEIIDWEFSTLNG